MLKRSGKKLGFPDVDTNFREVGATAFKTAFLRSVGTLALLGVNVLIARLLGVADTGLYFSALAIITIGSVVAKVGLENALLRHVAAHAAIDDWDSVKGVAILGLRVCVLMAIATTALVFILAPYISDVVVESEAFVVPLKLMSLSILPMALSNLLGQNLKAVKRITEGMLIQAILPPILMLFLVYPLAKILGINGVFVAYLTATSIVAISGWWRWRTALSHYPHAIPSFRVSTLWDSCKYLYPTSLINQALLPWFPLLVLSVYGTTEDVGIFGAALRMAALIAFLKIAINQAIAPKFAELYAKNEIELLARIARMAAFLTTAMASPAIIALLFFGDWIMGVYGPDFTDGGSVLAILIIGQTTNTALGSVDFLLTMTGNERTYLKITYFTAVVIVLLSVTLIPVFGIHGAAITSCSALITKNVLCWYHAQMILGIQLNWLKRGRLN